MRRAKIYPYHRSGTFKVKKNYWLAMVIILVIPVFFFLISPDNWWIIALGIGLVCFGLMIISKIVTHHWPWSLWLSGIITLLLTLKTISCLTTAIGLVGGLLLLSLAAYFFL